MSHLIHYSSEVESEKFKGKNLAAVHTSTDVSQLTQKHASVPTHRWIPFVRTTKVWISNV